MHHLSDSTSFIDAQTRLKAGPKPKYLTTMKYGVWTYFPSAVVRERTELVSSYPLFKPVSFPFPYSEKTFVLHERYIKLSCLLQARPQSTIVNP